MVATDVGNFCNRVPILGAPSTLLGGLTFTSIRGIKLPFDIIIFNGAVIDGREAEAVVADVGVHWITCTKRNT